MQRKPKSAMFKLFPSICKPPNLGDSEEFSQRAPGTQLILTSSLRAPPSWFNLWMSLFRVQKKFTWFTQVHIHLPPDELIMSTRPAVARRAWKQVAQVVPVSPTGTRGSFPRIFSTGMTYRRGFFVVKLVNNLGSNRVQPSCRKQITKLVCLIRVTRVTRIICIIQVLCLIGIIIIHIIHILHICIYMYNTFNSINGHKCYNLYNIHSIHNMYKNNQEQLNVNGMMTHACASFVFCI